MANTRQTKRGRTGKSTTGRMDEKATSITTLVWSLIARGTLTPNQCPPAEGQASSPLDMRWTPHTLTFHTGVIS